MIAQFVRIAAAAWRFAGTEPTDGHAVTYQAATKLLLPAPRAEHACVCIYASAGTNVVISNIGAGPSGVSSNLYQYVDLRRATVFRIQAVVNVAATGATLRAQYSLNGGGAWSDLEASGTSADISIATPALVLGTFGTIATAARVRDCLVRLAGYGGNGTDDPGFRMLALETREAA